MSDTMIDEFQGFLDQQEHDFYFRTHKKRYFETYKLVEPYLAGCSEVVELGGVSPITRFLKDRRHMRVTEIVSDLRQPWAVNAEKFDAVFSLEVLEHLHDRLPPEFKLMEFIRFSGTGAQMMFTETFRVLKAGAFLFLTTPNANSIDVVANVISGKHPFLYKPHVREYTPADVEEMATAAGFAVELVTTFPAWRNYPPKILNQIFTAVRSIEFDFKYPWNDALFVFRKPK
jgi:hypothetical protein